MSEEMELEYPPFDPPPEEYSYRCSHCGYEVWIGELIVDVESGFAEFEGKQAGMPILECYECNKDTMKFTGDKKSAR